jgi:ABC-type nitrate/sulfonate/bicarbonate transport system permease component
VTQTLSAPGARSMKRLRAPLWMRLSRTRIVLLLAPLVVLGVLLGAWAIYAAHSAGHLFPTVGETARGLGHSLVSGSDWSATLRSWRTLAIGYGIAVALGVPLGLTLGRSRNLDRLFGTYLDIALVVPMIVLMPVVLLAVGVTAKAQVVVIVLFALPYVVLPVRNHVRRLPRVWLDLASTLGASRIRLWRFVLFPGARSGIVLGLRLGLAHALSGLFIAELTLISLGIGQVILADQSNFDFGPMIGYIIIVMAQVVIVMALLRSMDTGEEEA